MFNFVIMELSERFEKAHRLHSAGYNCAQCVLMSLSDKLSLDENTLATIGAALGAGVSRGEICGVPNAMAIAIGLKQSDSAPDGKKRAMPVTKKLTDEFCMPYDGRITCRDLKGKCGAGCDQLIAEGINILNTHFNEKNV